MQNLKPYIEVIQESKDEKLKRTAPQKAATQKKRAELAILQLEEKIATKEQRLFDLASAPELNFDAIIDAQDEIALDERRCEQLKQIITQLFPG